MTDAQLTVDEKRCLQMWFRHAIARVEREEVGAQIAKFHGLTDITEEGHRTPVIRRRTRRNSRPAHIKQLV